MNFNKIYNIYLEKYLNEGMLGSVAAAIPRTVGYIAKDIATAGLKDNLVAQAFGQVRQKQSAERNKQRTEENAIKIKIENDFINDPSFINKKIQFEDSSKPLNITASYNELTNSKLKAVSIPEQEAIKELVGEKDLNSLSLYNDNVKQIIINKIKQVTDQHNKENKQDMGEDYKKVKIDPKQILMKIERELKDTFKPIGTGSKNKSLSNKITWMYIISSISNTNLKIKR